MASSTQAEGLIERTHFASAPYMIDLWVMRPARSGKYPIIIYNHGSRMQANGLVASSRPTVNHDMPLWTGVMAGACAVAFPQGRGYAGSDGPKLEDCRDWPEVWQFLTGRAQDVSACVSWLEAQSWADTSKLMVCGCSHGAIVSLLAQANLKVSGTVIQAPGAGDHAQKATQPEILRALGRATSPILIQHAEHDLRAPIAFSRSLHHAARAGGIQTRLHEYPFQKGLCSHGQFDWHNRHIWGHDFDRFAAHALGVTGPIAGEPS